jgi:hypothetical protein
MAVVAVAVVPLMERAVPVPEGSSSSDIREQL